MAAWSIFQLVGELACEADPARTTRAFDAWDGSEVVASLARRSGSGDAHAWRVVELARALLALGPGELVTAAAAAGMPSAWLGSSAVRAATGWNEWQGVAYVSQEGWDEFVGTLAERDALVDAEGVTAAAVSLKRRAATAGYRVVEPVGDSADHPTKA
jgi:hypothetical protein